MTVHPNDSPQISGTIWKKLFSIEFVFFLLFLFLGFAAVFLLLQRNNSPPSNELSTADFRFIPPELIGYRQAALSVCPVEGTARCFAVQNDSTFIVAATAPNALYFFDEKGTLLRKTELDDEPKAVICGTAETIFTGQIVIAHPKKIVLYNAEGKKEHTLGQWEQDNKVRPKTDRFGGHTGRLYKESPFDEYWGHKLNDKSDISSLALTPDALYAADSGKCLIHVISRTGVLSSTFGEPNIEREMSWEPTQESAVSESFSTLSVSPDNDLGVASGKITYRDNVLFAGFVVYASPMTLTYSPKSKLLYIANPGKHRVEVFTPNGVYQSELSWGEPSGDVFGFVGCCNPIAISVLSDCRIMTVEKSASRIKIFGKDRQLDCVVAGANVLEDISSQLKRKPSPPGGRYFSAAELSDKRIAVFDFDYGILRFFAAKE